MITINRHFNFWKMESFEHYEHNGVVVRAWAIDQKTMVKGVEKNFCAFSVSIKGDEKTDHYFEHESDMIEAIKAIMFGVVVAEEEEFDEIVNQGRRDCIITEVKKTRFRIGYEMPNTGYMEGWRKITFVRNGVKYYATKEY